MRGSNTKSI